jgi:hypothetical protein
MNPKTGQRLKADLDTLALRHHNPQQKSSYDPEIWLDWMFYFYLSTIRAVLRMIERKG